MRVTPARWWRVGEDGRVVCTLCPRYCRMADGQAGFCFLRRNEGGRLVTLGYGRTTGFAVDPVEKKPLNHFLPGTRILSFGTVGCNLGCRFCQNWDISKARDDARHTSEITPDEIADLAEAYGCPSLAMTYNDPVIWAEFAADVVAAAGARGLRSVLVTAGYVSDEARAEHYRGVAAANIDLKAFTEDFYHRLTYSSLAPVLETLRHVRRATDVWLEITTLLIPGHNDGPDEVRRLAGWIRDELGDEVPLHFTAFHPDWRMRDVPPTPPATLTEARRLALEVGLKHVYTGNVRDPDGQTTWCPGCGAAVIRRVGYQVDPAGLRGGACARCERPLAGVFDIARSSDGARRSLGGA